MGIRPIIKMGNPILRMNAEVVRPEDVHSLTSIIPDMITTMREARGVGLAAPQIGISLRVIIFEIPSSRATSVKGDRPCDVQVLINPKIDPFNLGERVRVGGLSIYTRITRRGPQIYADKLYWARR